MSLPQLLAIPPGPGGLEVWSFAHQSHHLAIIRAALAGKKAVLNFYPIYPFSPKNAQAFLLAHQAMHDQMNQLYGLNGNDLTSVDLSDKKQLDAFTFLNAKEHEAVAAICGQPI